MSASKAEGLVMTLVDVYTSTTAEQDIAKARRISQEKQLAAKQRAAQFESAQTGLYVLTGFSAAVMMLIALRTFSRARQLA